MKKKAKKILVLYSSMGRKKLNKKRGRPGKYVVREKPETGYAKETNLQLAIADYFDRLSKKEIPNKAGLLAHLDISRKTYSEYAKRFGNTIRRCNSLIESAWVNRLASPGATGAIFYLKNAYKELYQDKHEQDLNVRTPKPILGGVTTKDENKGTSKKV